MWPLRRVLKYGLVAGGTVGTLASLKANQYNLDSIGIVRFGRAAFTVGGIAFLYKSRLYSANLDKSTLEYVELKSSVHREAADRLLKLCCINKGVFIKVGQHIGALDYILPIEYVETMRVLHSNAPRSSITELYQVIREDLKKDPKELFQTFAEDPLGTASLAQVHKATLSDGRVVAVKVQHPYVRGNSTVDMKTMEFLVQIITWMFPEFKFDWLVEETRKNIPVELDFTQEAKNAEKIGKIFDHLPWLKVPKIYWNLTSPRVLTMEYMEGGQINDMKYIKSNKINTTQILKNLGVLYSEMIFIHGFVHSDPHPGNVLVRNSPKGNSEIVLLDHGLYASLSNEFRWEYSKLWLSILNADKSAMKHHAQNLGVGNLYGLFACMVSGRTWDSIMSGLNKTKFSTSEKSEFQKVLPTLLPQISDILSNANREIILILKTNDLMRNIEHTFKSDSKMSSFFVMSRCCIKSLYDERRKHCKTRFDRLLVSLAQQWELFKLNVYYTFLTLRNYTVALNSSRELF